MSKVLTFICAAFIIIAFFLPWLEVKLEPNLPQRIAGAFSSRIAASLTTRLTGLDIPLRAARMDPGTRTLIETLSGGKDVVKRAYLAYGIPAAAVICFVLSRLSGRSEVFALLQVITAGGVAVVGAHKLLSAPLSGPGYAIEPLPALWGTLAAFALIAAAGVMSAAEHR